MPLVEPEETSTQGVSSGSLLPYHDTGLVYIPGGSPFDSGLGQRKHPKDP